MHISSRIAVQKLVLLALLLSPLLAYAPRRGAEPAAFLRTGPVLASEVPPLAHTQPQPRTIASFFSSSATAPSSSLFVLLFEPSDAKCFKKTAAGLQTLDGAPQTPFFTYVPPNAAILYCSHEFLPVLQAAVPCIHSVADVPPAHQPAAARGTIHNLTTRILIGLKPVFSVDNHFATEILQTGGDGTHGTRLWDAGINGTGHKLAVADTGINFDSPFFHDPDEASAGTAHRKVAGYIESPWGGDALDTDGHGTHVCGSAVGNPDGSGCTGANLTALEEWRGLAFGAKVDFFDFESQTSMYLGLPGDLAEDLFLPAVERGAYIHSNSWGSSTEVYTASSGDVDRAMHHERSLLAVFSAGNSGANGLRTIGTPANAKNGLVVGASLPSRESYSVLCCDRGQSCCTSTTNDAITYNPENIASFSSKGPTYDLRIKPDIVTPGINIFSATSLVSQFGCSYGWDDPELAIEGMQGTSMATPHAAGGAVLVRQVLIERHGHHNPSGALIKAVIINSAEMLSGIYWNSQEGEFISLVGGPGPEFAQGWGRPVFVETLADDTYTAWSNDILLVDDVSLDSDESYAVSVEGSDTMCVTLTWSDPESQSSNYFALVNDLDLLVIEADGTAHFPNGRENSPDELNNVEKTCLNISGLGVVFIQVSAKWVVSEQEFALVVMGTNFSVVENVAISCPQMCNTHGTCNEGTGLCDCDEGYIGASCDVAMYPLALGVVDPTESANLGQGQWHYYSVDHPTSTAVTITVTVSAYTLASGGTYTWEDNDYTFKHGLALYMSTIQPPSIGQFTDGDGLTGTLSGENTLQIVSPEEGTGTLYVGVLDRSGDRIHTYHIGTDALLCSITCLENGACIGGECVCNVGYIGTNCENAELVAGSMSIFGWWSLALIPLFVFRYAQNRNSLAV